jgi:hypothetical protein
MAAGDEQTHGNTGTPVPGNQCLGLYRSATGGASLGMNADHRRLPQAPSGGGKERWQNPLCCWHVLLDTDCAAGFTS